MNVWAEVRDVLLRLSDDEARPLRSYPDPRIDIGRTPPFQISFAAWADEVAAELHARFGDSVDLQVGLLHFPDRSFRSWDGSPGTPPAVQRPPRLDPSEIEVGLEREFRVRSGHDAQTVLGIRNLTGTPRTIKTNGSLTGTIVDPVTDEVVGGYAGAQIMPLVLFEVAARSSLSIPLLIGTASFRPTLGYAVPPGRWAVETILEGFDGPGRTPPIGIEVLP
jgi:hypothetical protein